MSWGDLCQSATNYRVSLTERLQFGKELMAARFRHVLLPRTYYQLSCNTAFTSTLSSPHPRGLVLAMHFLKTSLFSSLVLLVASAIPVSSTALTPDTFDSTIQKGLWFIEHFSPYCGHCKHFKPTWEQLVAETQTEIPEVKTATVDCIMYGGVSIVVLHAALTHLNRSVRQEQD